MKTVKALFFLYRKWTGSSPTITPFVRTVDTFRFVLNVKIYLVLALFYIKRTFYMTVWALNPKVP